MARVRRTFQISMAGGDTFTVETNALDLVKAERDGQGSVAQGLRTAHMACLRHRLAVPVKFDDFCTDLDDFTDITEEPAEEEDPEPGDLDPTQ